MGSAMYHARIILPNKIEDENNPALREISLFIEEMRGMYNFWQANRNSERGSFWDTVMDSYPTAYEHLKEIGLAGEDNNNALAGTLDVGDEDSSCLTFEGRYIFYVSENVWHFSNWSQWLSFIGKKVGAESWDWISDEYATDVEIRDFMQVEEERHVQQGTVNIEDL